MLPHTELINYVIEKKGFKSYLEIGVHKPEHNFDLIKCQFKIGVDPNPQSKANFTGTSDEFFQTIISEFPLDGYKQPDIFFDCIFIDGLHWSEQVKKDFENSLACLNEGGVILIHDTDPKTEEYASWPRNAPRRWNGDVYKFMYELRKMNGVDYATPDIDANGITVVKENFGVINIGLNAEPSYQHFVKERKYLLNLCTLNEFKEWL